MTTVLAAGVPTPMYIHKCAFSPGFPESRQNCKKPGIAVELLLYVANVLQVEVKFVQHHQEDQFVLLDNNLVDMFIDAKTLKLSRIARAAYSTFPIDEQLTYHILIKSPSPDVVLMHTRPLSETFWYCVIGISLGIAAAWLLYSFCQVNKSPNVDKLGRKVAIGHSAQSFLYIQLGLSMGLFLSLYSSVLTIALSKQGGLPLPFDDLSGLAEGLLVGDYQMISRNNTLIHREIVCPVGEPLDSVLVDMQMACEKSPPLLELDDNQLIKKVSENHRNVAIVGSQLLRTIRIKYPQLITIPTKLPSQFAVFYYSRNSTFRVPTWLIERISEKYENLLDLYEDNFEDRQLEKQSRQANTTDINSNSSAQPLQPLNAAQMRGAFFTLLGGISLGLIALGIETHCWRRQKSSHIEEVLVSFLSLALVGPKSPS